MTDLVTDFSNRIDLHQSPQYANLMQSIGWQVSGIPGSQIFYRHLGPLAIAKMQRSNKLDFRELRSFRSRHHALTTYIEPGLKAVIPGKLGLPVEPFSHSCTSIIDIGPSQTKILASFTQKTRYNITHSLKKDDLKIVSTPLSTINNEQMTDFFALVTHWSKHKQVAGHSIPHLQAVINSFADAGELHLAYHDTSLVGSLLTLYHDSVATYYAAFATQLGNRLYAPTLLTWRAITKAKHHDCDIFDFGGIYDPRYPKLYKKWQGFTKFKAGFNPTIVAYPPTSLQLFW